MELGLKRGLLLSALLPIGSVCAQGKPIHRDQVTIQEVTTPLNTASADDYLLDLARAAHINAFADATDFPTAASIKQYPATLGAIAGQQGPYKDRWGPSLINLMGEFAAQERLSTLRTDDRTFLFWSEPNPYTLFAAQLAATQAAETARFADAVDTATPGGVLDGEIIGGDLPRSELQRVLLAYLKNAHHWTPTAANRNQNVDIRVRFTALPLGLRALLLRDLRDRFVPATNYQAIQDAFWKATDVRIRTERSGNDTLLGYRYAIHDMDGTERLRTFPLMTLDAADLRTKAPTPPTTLPAAIPLPVEEPAIVQNQTNAQDEFIKAYSGLSDEADDPALNADAALGAAISLHVKRVSLRDVLAQVQQQSGVSLTLDATAPATRLLTAHVEKMPLARFMAVLARIYGVKWRKAGTTYAMRGNDSGELHLQLLRVGDPKEYRYRFRLFNRPDREAEKVTLGHDIVQQVGIDAVQTLEGVSVATLPQPLQNRLQRNLAEPLAELNAIALYQTNRVLVEQLTHNGLVLRFGTPVSKAYRAPYQGFGMGEPADRLRFNVQSDDGKLVLPVFDFFGYFVAKPGEQVVPLPGRRR